MAFVNGCTNDGLVSLGVCDAPNWRDSVHAACNGISGVIQNLDTLKIIESRASLASLSTARNGVILLLVNGYY